MENGIRLCYNKRSFQQRCGKLCPAGAEELHKTIRLFFHNTVENFWESKKRKNVAGFTVFDVGCGLCYDDRYNRATR